MLLSSIEKLPVDLVGEHVLGCLDLKDIVMLERACGSKASHQLFLNLIVFSPPIALPSHKHRNIITLEWLSKRRCRLGSLTIWIPTDNPGLHVKNLEMNSINLIIESNVTIEKCNPFFDLNKADLVMAIDIQGDQDKEVMEQFSLCARNVISLTVWYANNYKNWLSVDILSRWKVKQIRLFSCTGATQLLSLIVQTCTELTDIAMYSRTVDDTVVMEIAQHCRKLEKLQLTAPCKITYHSLIILSECGLLLTHLNIGTIPNIPTADIARRCSHALSCIRHLDTYHLHQNDPNSNILIPYMTGLTSVSVQYTSHNYIPLLAQYCHKINQITLYCPNCHVSDMLSLCRANPLLQVLYCQNLGGCTDTTLIELIHACPQLHTLRLPYETNITDIGILALSEHYSQLQELLISKCHKITEAAVLQLLQRCRKLTRLVVSSSSLSEETWTQLDRNTQKRVILW